MFDLLVERSFEKSVVVLLNLDRKKSMNPAVENVWVFVLSRSH